MAVAVVTLTARRDLEALIRSHSLPASTRQRVRASIEPLRDFPELGARLNPNPPMNRLERAWVA